MEALLYILVVGGVISLVAGKVTNYAIEQRERRHFAVAGVLSGWMVDLIEKGEFEKAYRVCLLIHNRTPKENYHDFIVRVYKDAIMELSTAKRMYNHAFGKAEVDGAIVRLERAEKIVELVHVEARKGGF